MKKRNQITQAVLLTAAGVSSLAAMAETQTVTSTVTVNNAIGFVSTGTLDFGALRAVPDVTAAQCAYLVLPADPTATALTTGTSTNATAVASCVASAEDAAAIQFVSGTIARPSFDISGVPQFTTLNLTLPDTTATPVSMTSLADPSGPEFQLWDFKAFRTLPSTLDLNTATDGTDTVQVGAAGTATFVIGATIATEPAAPSALYVDGGAYTGSIDVIVTY